MSGWAEVFELLVTSAAGSVVASLAAPARCHCECLASRAPEPALELLREQLQRCGPERLSCPTQLACPEPPGCPPPAACVGAFVLGALFGALLAVLAVLGYCLLPQQRRPERLAVEQPVVRDGAGLAAEARQVAAAVRSRAAIFSHRWRSARGHGSSWPTTCRASPSFTSVS